MLNRQDSRLYIYIPSLYSSDTTLTHVVASNISFYQIITDADVLVLCQVFVSVLHCYACNLIDVYCLYCRHSSSVGGENKVKLLRKQSRSWSTLVNWNSCIHQSDHYLMEICFFVLTLMHVMENSFDSTSSIIGFSYNDIK
jgi:hypothetical protein